MSRSRIQVAAVDPRLPSFLRAAALCGLALVTCLPAARGFHAGIGWLPLWLVLMPATAWAVLALRGRGSVAVMVKRRRRSPQAVPLQARRARRERGRQSVARPAWVD